MKIIGVGMNYALHKEELKDNSATVNPIIFMKPESALLKEGKPFFIPDFATAFQYETELVVRINRLGKNIASRFASRYYEEITVGKIIGALFVIIGVILYVRDDAGEEETP